MPALDRLWSMVMSKEGKAGFSSCLIALGIVYGDIGTSPLYAFRAAIEACSPNPGEAECLGVLSLIIWAIILTVSVKYIGLVLKADNQGEGGILALLTFVVPWQSHQSFKQGGPLLIIGLFGAALLYGDGVITPAISVLSSVEGIGVITNSFSAYVMPITVAIIVVLFLVQYKGTEFIGKYFGPIMLVWFITIGLLGVAQIARFPKVLIAINPLYALSILTNESSVAFAVMGAVFLAVTGGEALYADMGHVGRKPIQVAWIFCVFPCLLLNYAGQAALILMDPNEIANPFYHMAPDFALIPLVLLATCATIIASQALISGVFSLTQQACNMGLLPRIHAVQTSASGVGQVYLPTVNYLLMAMVIAVVIEFKTSDALAGAYGAAVSLTMLGTTILLYNAMRHKWKWNAPFVLTASVLFITLDAIFGASCVVKAIESGWVSLVVSAIIFYIMYVWNKGTRIIFRRLDALAVPVEYFTLTMDSLHRVEGTSVFISRQSTGVPSTLLTHTAHNHVLHRHVIILNIESERIPRILAKDRLSITKLAEGLWRVQARYGFMQAPNIPVIMVSLEKLGLPCNTEKIRYYMGHERVVGTESKNSLQGIERMLFTFLSNNAARPSDYFKIPDDKIVEMGLRVDV